jgi:tetratricopeptide (TPR) repeat protein
MEKKESNEFLQMHLSDEELTEQLLPPLEEFRDTPMRPASQQREQRREELLELLKMSGLVEELTLALQYLIEASETLLSKRERELLFLDLHRIAKFLEENSDMDLETMFYFAEKAKISTEVVEIIDRLTAECYEKREFLKAAFLGAFYCMLEMSLPRAWLLRGLANKSLEHYDLAIKCFTNVIDLAPELPYGYLYAGECCLAVKDQLAAAELLQQGLKLLPKEEFAWRKEAKNLLESIK